MGLIKPKCTHDDVYGLLQHEKSTANDLLRYGSWQPLISSNVQLDGDNTIKLIPAS